MAPPPSLPGLPSPSLTHLHSCSFLRDKGSARPTPSSTAPPLLQTAQSLGHLGVWSHLSLCPDLLFWSWVLLLLKVLAEGKVEPGVQVTPGGCPVVRNPLSCPPSCHSPKTTPGFLGTPLGRLSQERLHTFHQLGTLPHTTGRASPSTLHPGEPAVPGIEGS